MSNKAERGTKRTCQSASCHVRFYDLNRDPIVCPACGTIFESAETAVPPPPPAEKVRRPAKKPEFAESAAQAEAVEGEDALADIEVADDTLDDDAATDDTFLEAEEEEDGGDVSGIIGGPVAEGDEEV